MNEIKDLISIVLLVLFMSSCVDNDDYGIPIINNGEGITIPENKITTFRAIHNRYEQAINNGNNIAMINVDEDIYLEGYVVSSDASGNFFEELIVQNKIDDFGTDSDPRLGVKIDINVSSLSDTYEFGRKVFIKLSGLAIGESSGVITIGKGDGAQVDQIQAAEYRDVVFKSDEIATIIPKTARIQDLSEADENTLVKLENVQLNRFELGATYAGESIDEFDGLRTLESCDSGVSIIMQTSTFSDFKSVLIGEGKGTVTGIFSRDYGDDFNVIAINSTTDVVLDDNERCDPIEFSCGLANAIGTGNLFYENFESQKNNKIVVGNGWTNYIEAGTQGWEGYSSTSPNASLGRSARFQSASSGDHSNIGWLITPAINLDAQDGETLRFKTSNSLADSSFMEVLYSLDWDGAEANVTTAVWSILSDAYVVKDTDSFAPWFNSGNVDLSCLSGTIYIAFKYTGSGQDTFDGVYELDEVSVDYMK